MYPNETCSMINPTQRTYRTLDDAYSFFNERLFAKRLPHCLITMQRQSKAYGYFAGGRFGSADGTEVTDEIALNPLTSARAQPKPAFLPSCTCRWPI